MTPNSKISLRSKRGTKRKISQKYSSDEISDSDESYKEPETPERDETPPSTSQDKETPIACNVESIHLNFQPAMGAEKSETSTSKRSRNRNVIEKPSKIKDTFSILHFKQNNTNMFMPYVPGRWSPEVLYRLPHDITISTIRKNGSEGLGRAEIGQTIGFDATVKSGGRRVTTIIVNSANENPDHIGQYQKMDGKIRSIRYFWKKNAEPERFAKLFKEFEENAGIPCPFKIGEVIKFPDQKLNTLRISDVTLTRLNRLLRLVSTLRVIVTMHRLIKMITEEEAANGYNYQIDKKSVTKCILALKKHKLIQLWNTVITSETVDYNIQILGHRDIKTVEDPEVEKGIQAILDEYNREGRVFPHGQLRSLVKPKNDGAAVKTEFEGDLKNIDEDLSKPRKVNDRFHFYRLQSVRNSWNTNKTEEEEEETTVKEEIDEIDESILEAINTDEDHFDGFQTNRVVVKDNKKKMSAIMKKRCIQYYFGKESIGYQSKAIRMYLTHIFAHHFVYGHPAETSPNVYQIFPPTNSFETWPSIGSGEDLSMAHVFVNEESPYRFMPPQPNFEDVQRGWFMLGDFLAALPLSILVMLVYIPKKIEKNYLSAILRDPIRRHLCVGYLPKDVRDVLIREKKIHKQLEHTFFLLASIGLVAIGTNPFPKRFPSPVTTMICVAQGSFLLDTSTSQKSYACVTLPLSIYTRHDYTFSNRKDVTLYWHHLRAIVQSTPLSYRIDENSENGYSSRHKMYSCGGFDRKLVEYDYKTVIDVLQPVEPRDGVSGFDSQIFLHLKRHWELVTVPHNTISWFISSFRRDADEVKDEIKTRVRILQNDWNSFVKSLMPSDLELSNAKKQVTYTLNVSYPRPKLNMNTSQKEPAMLQKKKKTKKRAPDSVDLLSSSTRIYIRCRFTSKERDMLIMIRAVGFFLNPVYRFWLDPTVLRDLMHEFVPESRTKTVQSLMACGARELVRNSRLAFLQRIVRSLSTFPEMRKLRYDLMTKATAKEEEKINFFKVAFKEAMSLLFADNNRLPPSLVSDEVFSDFLKEGNVKVTREAQAINPIPYRSQKPTNVQHILHCVATNVLLSVLIHSIEGHFPEGILDQISPKILQGVLQALRSDGLVSRSRQLDPKYDLVTKNQAALSFYFRHLFTHRYHADLIEESGAIFEQVAEETHDEMIELTGDSAAGLLAASSAFIGSKYVLDMEVDDDIMDAFSRVEEDQTTKKIRYLESTNLHFEKIHVYLDHVEVEKKDNAEEGENEDEEEEDHEKVLNKLIKKMGKSVKILKEGEKVEFSEWNKQFESSKSRQLETIMSLIRESKQTGMTFEELIEGISISSELLLDYLNEMCKARQLTECGVDEKRWAIVDYEKIWKIRIENDLMSPRAWIKSDKTVCLSTIRWFAESIFLVIVNKLGIPLNDLISLFEFAIQPITIREIIEFLVDAKCIKIIEKEYETRKMVSAFDERVETTRLKYLMPIVDGMERFSKLFHRVPFLSTMASKCIEDRR